MLKASGRRNRRRSDDFGYRRPDIGWQLSPFAPTHGIDGPVGARALGHRNNVFQFIRVEDIAYDKRPGMQNIVYIVDSGRGLQRGPAAGLSTNGRIWRMVLDPNDQTGGPVAHRPRRRRREPPSRTLRARSGSRTTSTRRQTALLVTEDPGSRQQFPADSTASERPRCGRSLPPAGTPDAPYAATSG